MQLDEQQLTLTVTSEEGVSVSVQQSGPFTVADDAKQAVAQIKDTLSKLGTTMYHAQKKLQVQAEQAWFVPNSQLKSLRRDAIEALTAARIAAHPKGFRKPVSEPAPVYPESHLTFLANVYNEKARAFIIVMVCN